MFRLFCALAVAFVATFHVCGIAAASSAAPTAMHAPAADDAPQDEAGLPGEKCHVCATVSLPALLATAEAAPDKIAVREASVRDLVSFQTSLTPPPPRV